MVKVIANVDKRPTIIGGMFDRIAPSYDTLNRILSLSIDRYWRKRTVRSLDIESGDLILDIATGTGDLALAALRAIPCRVVGIDLSLGMLQQAERKSDAYLHDRYSLVNGDATALPFRDGAFDRAMVAFGIRNVSGIDRCLDEVYRVIKPGGKIVILEFSLPSNPFFKAVYLTYFRHILPVVGGLVSGNAAAYRYLRDSVIDFLSPEELVDTIRTRGFTVESSTFFWGVTRLYTLKRKVKEASE